MYYKTLWTKVDVSTTVTVGTVAVIVNTILNLTTTTTRYDVLPTDVELPPMNEQGTRIQVITVPNPTGGPPITTSM